MIFSKLEKARDYEVKEWLEKSIKLSDYQKQKLYEDEVIRFSPFKFYKHKQDKSVSFLWRLTLLVFPLYWIILLLILPFKFMVTGEWGFGQKFVDNFHSAWIKKMGL